MAKSNNKKCLKCGGNISANAAFCPYCGTKFAKKSNASVKATSTKKVSSSAQKTSTKSAVAKSSQKSGRALVSGIKFSVTRIIVFLVIAALCGISFIFSAPLERIINFNVNNVSSDMVAANEAYLKVHYLDAGQADCTVIELPDNKIMMIDCGLELSNKTKNATHIMNYLDNIIFANRAARIDYFIITHADYDHTAAAEQVLNKYSIGIAFRPHMYYFKSGDAESEVFDSSIYKSDSTATWKSTVKAIDNNAESVEFNDKDLGTVINYDDTNDSKDYTFTFYGPVSKKYSDKNDYSPVMILNNNGNTFMFTGDATSAVEKEMMDYIKEPGGFDIEDFDIDVLKVGHHGSRTSSSANFLKATTPTYAIISSGGEYGHPHNEVVNRISDIGATILRTDTSGSIVGFVSSSGSINFVLDVFDPNLYHIKWSYVAVSILVVSAVICFIPKKNANKKKQ